MSNPCIRCGKQRIDGKTWKEKLGGNIITHTLTLCPDKNCQKEVDALNLDKRNKNELLAKKRLEAKQVREKLVLAGAS